MVTEPARNQREGPAPHLKWGRQDLEEREDRERLVRSPSEPTICVQSPAQSHLRCVTLGKLLNFSELQCLQMQNGVILPNVGKVNKGRTWCAVDLDYVGVLSCFPMCCSQLYREAALETGELLHNQ